MRDKKLTKCNLGTTDYAKKVEGKTQKVIAFYKKELEKKVKQN